MSGGEGFNVDGNRRYQWPARQLGMWSGSAGRPKGHNISKPEMVRKINEALRDREGPAYKWWAAGVLRISEPTLRVLLHDYELLWPPPWPPPA